MKVPLLFFLFAVLLSENAYGQVAPAAKPPAAKPPIAQPPAQMRVRRSVGRSRRVVERVASTSALSAPLPLYESVEEIQNTRPEISDTTLSQDSEAIQDSLPTIRDIYSERGFSYGDADSAVLYGWKQLRLKVLEPTEALSTDALITYVSGFGKLIIKSEPPGAVVELQGNKLLDKTHAVAWPSAGTYRIKLSMDGYEPVEDTCAVQEGQPTLFERSLKRVKRKPASQQRRIKPQ